MRALFFFRILALLLGIVALSMALPLVVGVIYGEAGMIRTFGITMGAVLALALPAAFLTRKQRIFFSAGDGCCVVFLAWTAACLLGAAPYYLSGYITNFPDAVFESVSGFTTTGATIIPDIEVLPQSLIFWRAMTHWLGGMGIVALSVALLPLLGVGAFQLVKAESPGPEKGRIIPKITANAKLLCLLYVGLTGCEMILLVIGGMDWFDAAAYAFSTIATGGFSPQNAGAAAYSSPGIHWVIILFMFLGGCNFTLLYRLFQGKFREAVNNSEARAYLLIILCAGGIIFFSLASQGASVEKNLRYALFHALSILTTTGFTLADHNLWPAAAQGVLFFLMFLGGCSSSTAGGIKVIRFLILFKQGKNELMRLLYPRGVFAIRLNRKVGRKDVVYGAAGFVFLYLVLVFASAFLVSTAGLDPFSSFNAGLLALGNIGLGLGVFSTGVPLLPLPAYVKWGLSFIMIAGRLELWTALVFFSRDYWRR
ncbi:MAG: TrkH family potassium uptake protein [Treponema sp.]|jgi:trk system potassium uptake protein TrkH|nr:TrkH family potassium uptake protein [Treponema sp.]